MTTTFQDKQKSLFDQVEDAFKKGETLSTIVDPIDDYENDNQICLTSVAFIPTILKNKISSLVIKPLKKTDPSQYFYSPESLHLTIQNIRVINNPPRFTDTDIRKARQVFSRVIQKHQRIKCKIHGLFDLPSSLGVRVYSDESLKNLCLDLRNELAETGIPDDKKYASDKVVFGNISVARYSSRPNDHYFEKLRSLKNIEIGNFTVETVNLITTNSVCHPKKTKIHGQYNLQ